MFIIHRQALVLSVKEYCAMKKLSRTTEWRLRNRKKVKPKKK